MKFITFFSSLLVLLNYCQLHASIQKVYIRWTPLCVELLCEARHNSSWHSQPKANCTYLGNIIMAASVVFSGGTFGQFKSIANIANNVFKARTVPTICVSRNVCTIKLVRDGGLLLVLPCTMTEISCYGQKVAEHFQQLRII